MTETGSTREGWYVTIAFSVFSALAAASVSQFSATLTQVAELLGTTKETVAFLDAVKSFFAVFSMLTAPYCIKKFGARAVFAGACFFFLMPQIAMPFTGNYTLFTVLKCVQGLNVYYFPLALLVVAQRSRPCDIGLATAVFMGATYAGGAVGGTIAGICLSVMDWRSAFHAISIPMVLISVILFFVLPKTSEEPAAGGGETKGGKGAYQFVVRNKLTWFLIFAFLPTVWTVQAIWSDMIPFGQYLGFSDSALGGVMSVSAFAIMLVSLISGKTSDWFASRGQDKLRRRVGVFLLGTILILIGVVIMLAIDISPSDVWTFNGVVFVLSVGAAWGLGSFYGIFPEYFRGDEVSAANGFIGGCADMAMPLSPIFMAAVGIGMNRWHEAWLSCVVMAVVGFAFSMVILKQDHEKSRGQA